MIFNSYAFLAFFPIVTLAYYRMPMRARRPWLLAASYYFYMCWNAQYALLIAASTLVTYLCALALGRIEAKAGRHFVFFQIFWIFYRYIRANCRASGGAAGDSGV